MRSFRRSLVVFSCLIALSVATGPAVFAAPVDPATGTPPAAHLEVATDASDGTSRVVARVTFADGGTVERVLRETTSSDVTLRADGVDTSGRALFATWREGDTAWTAWSRSGGLDWTEAAPFRSGLHLRRGHVRPDAAVPSPAAPLRAGDANRLFLVRLEAPSLPEWRAAIAATGGEIVQFFPRHAHVVRIDAARLDALRVLPIVAAIDPFHPADRMEPALRDWLAGGSEPQGAFDGNGRLRVRALTFGWGADAKSRLARAAESAGASIATWWPNGHVLELWADAEELRAIANHDELAWIDRWTPADTDMDIGRQDTGADWLENNLGFCGDGVRGEVMDSGIQSDHPDFDGILHHGTFNTSSHGTSTYGIVFGNGARDGDGNAQATGFMPCDSQGIFADYGSLGDRFAHTEELKNEPYFASFQTNSWGNSQIQSYSSVSQEMDDIIWRLDIAITQSQSNTGNRNSRPQAWAKNIIAVGGVRHKNTLTTADDDWSGGASIGPAEDGRIKPDLHSYYDSIFTTTTGSGYTSSFGGTSGATPMVAGTMGLFLQMWSENVWNTDPQGATVFDRQPHAGTIKALLVNNAFQYDFSGTSDDLTRTHQGWGRPNVQTAYERAATSFVVDQDVSLGVGETALYDVVVAAGETELKITMIYPDPPGTTAANLHRINDVDLRVTSPSGDVYHGNVGLDVGTHSVPGGSPNGIDTVENVFVSNPEEGAWTVEVTASEVNTDGWLETPGDDVVFALVVTGAILDNGVCGNGIREAAEECDGADFADKDCAALACGSGTLGCTVDCKFETNACVDCPTCGDGTCDPNEDCETCPADCIFENTSSCGNGLCETGDGEDCLSCPEDCNGTQNGKPSNRFCCGDGDGENPVGCGNSLCTAAPFQCTSVPQDLYCCGDGTCEGVEDGSSCAVDCAPAVPGEAASPANGGMLQVAAFDPVTGQITLTYGAACTATDHVIEYGELTRANLESYTWDGQTCAVGTDGDYVWDASGTPESVFFVLVGTNSFGEGSYGTDSAGTDRPDDDTSFRCPRPQDLTFACSTP